LRDGASAGANPLTTGASGAGRQLFPDSIDLADERRPDGDACVSPIGRRRVAHRHHPRPVLSRRPSLTVLLFESVSFSNDNTPSLVA
jgi:hypothetical protein